MIHNTLIAKEVEEVEDFQTGVDIAKLIYLMLLFIIQGIDQ